MIETTLRTGSLGLGLLFGGLLLAGQPAKEPPAPPLLLIVDSSGSMKAPLGGAPKIDSAKSVVTRLINDFPPDVPLGLILYGHRRAKDCTDIELVATPLTSGAMRLATLSKTVSGLRPLGETPIAASLLQAADLFGDRAGRIILVTDGKEECGGDVCAAAARLARPNLTTRVDIVGFGLTAADRWALECVTKTTGGTYHDARDAGSLEAALRKATAEATTTGTLVVTVMELGRKASQTSVSARGKDGLSYSTADNPGAIKLPPGEYDLFAHVGIGRDRPAGRVTIEKGKTVEKTIEFGTGTIDVSLTAAGRPWTRVKTVSLWQNGATVAGLAQVPARFQTDAGVYEVRLTLSNGDSLKVPGVEVVAGQTVPRTLDVPLAHVTISFTRGEFGPGHGPFPSVELRQGGKFAASTIENPAPFLMAAGTYEVVVKKPPMGEVLVASVPLVLRAGDEITLDLK